MLRLNMLRLKRFYLNLKIRWKIFLIIMFAAFIFSTLGIAAIRISFYIYDMQLYKNVEKVLNMYSVNIEKKLYEINNLSYNILKDKEIQRNLEVLKNDESIYAQFVAANNINNRLFAWHTSMNSPVLSIQIIGNNGIEFSSEVRPFKMDESRKSEIIKNAMEQKGKILWLGPSGQDKAIIQARVIRGISNLNLDTLGTLIIRVDPTELINLYRDFVPEYNSSFYIISPTDIILGEKDDIDLNNILHYIKKNEGYFITDFNKEEKLIIYRKSTDTDWIFINIIPYKSIYKQTIAVRTIVILSYIIVLGMLISISFRFSMSITKPIENLIKRMKIIENSDFENLSEIDPCDDFRKDEIGVLQKVFRLMIAKISSLIKENYVKQIQLKEFEYKALQAQINPHFLYNTLDSINWMAKLVGQQQIALMVKSLADLLRCSISKKEPVITMKEEIKILNDYITIQKIRYQERLDISVNIGEEFEDCLITKFTLQPIVENSINYGLEKKPGICRILIEARSLPDKIEITIRDNGPGIRKDTLEALRRGEIQPKGSGIGLKNINERLKLIFGLQYGLEIDSIEDKGTTVKVFIPLERKVNTDDRKANG